MGQYQRLEQGRDLRDQLRRGMDICLVDRRKEVHEGSVNEREEVLRYVGDFSGSGYSMFGDRQRYLEDRSNVNLTFLRLEGWEVDSEGRMISRGIFNSITGEIDISRHHPEFVRVAELLETPPEGDAE